MKWKKTSHHLRETIRFLHLHYEISGVEVWSWLSIDTYKVSLHSAYGILHRPVYTCIRKHTYTGHYTGPYTQTSAHVSIPFRTHELYGLIIPPYTGHFMQCNNVAICCVGMLRSFGRGLSLINDILYIFNYEIYVQRLFNMYRDS